jgi:hypothetical protein
LGNLEKSVYIMKNIEIGDVVEINWKLEEWSGYTLTNEKAIYKITDIIECKYCGDSEYGEENSLLCCRLCKGRIKLESICKSISYHGLCLGSTSSVPYPFVRLIKKQSDKINKIFEDLLKEIN